MKTPHKNAPNTRDSDLFVVKQQHHRDTPNAGPFLEIYSLLEDMDFSFDFLLKGLQNVVSFYFKLALLISAVVLCLDIFKPSFF